MTPINHGKAYLYKLDTYLIKILKNYGTLSNCMKELY